LVLFSPEYIKVWMIYLKPNSREIYRLFVTISSTELNSFILMSRIDLNFVINPCVWNKIWKEIYIWINVSLISYSYILVMRLKEILKMKKIMSIKPCKKNICINFLTFLLYIYIYIYSGYFNFSVSIKPMRTAWFFCIAREKGFAERRGNKFSSERDACKCKNF